MAGDEQEIMYIFAAALADLRDEAREYDERWDQIAMRGGYDASTIESEQDIRERIEMLHACVAASEAIYTAYANVMDDVIWRIDSSQLPPNVKHNVRNEASRDASRYKAAAAGFAIDRDCAARIVDLLELLASHWGEWHYDQEAAALVFDALSVKDELWDINDDIDRLLQSRDASDREKLSKPIGGGTP